MMDGFTWEWTVLHFLQGWHGPILNSFMVMVSSVTSLGLPWIIMGLILLIKPQTRIIGISVICALVISTLLGVEGLKNVVARPRPIWLDPSVHMLVKVPTDFSFPSGHTLATFAAAGAVWYYKRFWGYLLMLAGVVVGISRMYLYVHFPTDVLGGVVLGLFLGVIIAAFINKRFHKTPNTKSSINDHIKVIRRVKID